MTDLIAMMREYATDHYWLESWDIVADRWTDADIADAIKGATTRRGAIAKAWGKLQVIDALRAAGNGEVIFQYGRKPVRPASLFEFLAARGGLRPNPELRYILDGNPLVPRKGPLLRSSGLTLDHAREACVEAGYLQDAGAFHGGVTESTIGDLLDAIADEARGQKRYRAEDEGRLPIEFTAMETSDEIPF